LDEDFGWSPRFILDESKTTRIRYKKGFLRFGDKPKNYKDSLLKRISSLWRQTQKLQGFVIKKDFFASATNSKTTRIRYKKGFLRFGDKLKNYKDSL
jgi:hypothetical protein